MRILVTNDDGIDSVGLHVLAREMTNHGDVVIVAPDREFSGSGASIGHLLDFTPHASKRQVEGIDEAWALEGSPALVVLLSRLGAFGDPFDLVVSGINPGWNVGRTVYHSGTVGAALTARNGGITGIAVSQKTDFSALIGQGTPVEQKWETAAKIAGAVVAGVIAKPPAQAAAININVDNIDLSEVRGWKRAQPISPPVSWATSPGENTTPAVSQIPTDDPDRFELKMNWNRERPEPPAGSDAAAVNDGYAAITWLTDLAEDPDAGTGEVDEALDQLFTDGANT